jgi:predicted nucleic acid-binding protein
LLASADSGVELFQPSHFLAEVAAVRARLKPQAAAQDIANLVALDIAWAEPTQALARAVEQSTQLGHHLFDTLYHALALETPGATLVTADRRYFVKARHLGRVAWLPDFTAP